MNFRRLQKRSRKKAERSERASLVRKKDGTVRDVRKFKRKKRFGKSLNDRSPSRFLTRAKQKCRQYGSSYMEVKTKVYRASQYMHDSGLYRKVPLSQRTKEVGGHMVLRDPYSAFLLRCSNPVGTAPDRDMCEFLFPCFLKMQDALIAFSEKGHPVSFGF